MSLLIWPFLRVLGALHTESEMRTIIQILDTTLTSPTLPHVIPNPFHPIRLSIPCAMDSYLGGGPRLVVLSDIQEGFPERLRPASRGIILIKAVPMFTSATVLRAELLSRWMLTGRVRGLCCWTTVAGILGPSTFSSTGRPRCPSDVEYGTGRALSEGEGLSTVNLPCDSAPSSAW